MKPAQLMRVCAQVMLERREVTVSTLSTTALTEDLWLRVFGRCGDGYAMTASGA